MPKNENDKTTNARRTSRTAQPKRPDSAEPHADEQVRADKKAQTRRRVRKTTPKKHELAALTTQTLSKPFPKDLIAFIIIAICFLSLVGMLIFILARDTTAPVIQSVSLSDIREASVVITWQTDEPATSQVTICSPDVCNSTETDKTLVIKHSATLSNLKPNTTHRFTVISRDKRGNEATLEIELTTPSQVYTPPPQPHATPIIEIGKRAPDFTLPTLDGKQASLSQLQGKIVIVNFWLTTCSACRHEMPFLQAVYNSWSRDNLEILAVSVGEHASFVQSFVERRGLTFPALLDSDEAVSQLYQISSLPTTFFIDADGFIREIKEGRFRDQIEIENILKSL